MNNKPKKAKITDYLKNKVSYYTLKPVNTPKKVELIVTFKCNLKCPHCDSQKIKSVTELSINQWKTIVTKINNWLGPAFMMVAGGEPLLKEGIFDLLKFISKRNKFGIMTNGQHNKDKIKVSARVVGRGRNLKELMEKSVCEFEADVGGHQMAAGCLIKREDEREFMEKLRKNLEIEVVKV